MAVVPVGTGNLLARNLDIPLSESEALEVAFSEHTRDIDLIKVAVDGGPGEHFAVIGGLGVDAMIMEETNSELKDVIGAGAYFIAAGKALGRTPIDMRIALDDHRHDLRNRQRRQACRQSQPDSGGAARRWPTRCVRGVTASPLSLDAGVSSIDHSPAAPR